MLVDDIDGQEMRPDFEGGWQLCNEERALINITGGKMVSMIVPSIERCPDDVGLAHKLECKVDGNLRRDWIHLAANTEQPATAQHAEQHLIGEWRGEHSLDTALTYEEPNAERVHTALSSLRI